MIKVIKEKNYFYFLKNNKILTTQNNNIIRVSKNNLAKDLSKYLNSIY